MLIININSYAVFKVLYTEPKDGQVDVDFSLVVKIYFNKKLNKELLNPYYFMVYDDVAALEFSYRYDEKRKCINIILKDLDPDKKYTVWISKDLPSKDGEKLNTDYKFSFVTKSIKDDIPPILVDSYPHVGEKVFDLSSLVFVFSEPLDPKSIKGAVMLKNSNGILIPGKLTWNEEKLSLIFRPYVSLQPDMYWITISKKIRDRNGNYLQDDIKWNFWLLKESKVSEPFKAFLEYPKPNSEVKPGTYEIKVRFSVPVDPMTINLNNITLYENGEAVFSTLQYLSDTKTLLIKPSGGIKEGKVYRLVLTDNITDTMGRNLEPVTFRWFCKSAYFEVRKVNWGTDSITITFSEAPNPVTVHYLTVRLVTPDGKLIKWYKKKLDGNVLKIFVKPKQGMMLLINSLLSQTDKRIVSYKEVFKNQKLDITPPKVVEYYPKKRIVSSLFDVKVKFNEPIDLVKNPLKSIRLINMSTLHPVFFKVKVENNTLILSPIYYLKPGDYQLKINSNTIMDKSGNLLKQPIIYNFSVIR